MLMELLEVFGTGSLAAYARLYKLRTDPHAEKLGPLIEPHFPVSWKALTS
jgi:hypothetical protein